MRTLALLLAFIAAGKIALVEYLYRSTADDVIVSAYRPRQILTNPLNACMVGSPVFPITFPSTGTGLT